jgi:hypothetical protein
MHMKWALHQDANIRPILQYCLRPVRDHPQEVRALKPQKLTYRIIKGLPRGLTPSGFQIKTVNKCFCCCLPTLALISHPPMSSGNGKGCPIICQGGTEVRYGYSCTHLSPWNGMGGQHDALVTLPPLQKASVPLNAKWTVHISLLFFHSPYNKYQILQNAYKKLLVFLYITEEFHKTLRVYILFL